MIATCIVGPIIIIGFLLHLPLAFLEFMCQLWCKTHLLAAGVKVRTVDMHTLPEPPAVLVCNHQSLFDILALIPYLPRPPVFVCKKELFAVPIFGSVLTVMGHIALDRHDREKAIASINQGTKNLQKNKQNLVFFPEGTRPRDGRLSDFKKGAFVFALESGLPIVPVVIQGSFEILPPETRCMYPGTITLTLLNPVGTTGYNLGKRDQLKEEVRERIQAVLEKEALRTLTG